MESNNYRNCSEMETVMNKKIALYGMLVALAFVLNYIENILSFASLTYGIKLGLANVVVLSALYMLGYKEAFGISIVRIILAGITFGNIFSMWYSLAGGMLSYIFMAFGKKSNVFSIKGVSILGGVTHNVGQIIVAIIVLGTNTIAWSLPLLFITGTVAGLINGILGAMVVERVKM